MEESGGVKKIVRKGRDWKSKIRRKKMIGMWGFGGRLIRGRWFKWWWIWSESVYKGDKKDKF